MSAGLDAVILDPTDPELMAALLAAEAVLGRDDYCLGFLKAFRAGKVA
jgi:5-methyltetrahydrofolate--homocysteine methyltransferase